MHAVMIQAHIDKTISKLPKRNYFLVIQQEHDMHQGEYINIKLSCLNQ
jgi:hypothetical protein